MTKINESRVIDNGITVNRVTNAVGFQFGGKLGHILCMVSRLGGGSSASALRPAVFGGGLADGDGSWVRRVWALTLAVRLLVSGTSRFINVAYIVHTGEIWASMVLAVCAVFTTIALRESGDVNGEGIVGVPCFGVRATIGSAGRSSAVISGVRGNIRSPWVR